jgi:hypothetical protein
MLHASVKSLIRLGVLGVVIVAVVLASAIGGNAAGKNICAVPNSTTGASCVKEFLGPHFIKAAQNVLSVTEFTNESGVGGSTATHVVLSVTFPADVTIVSVNGVSPAPSGCTPIPSSPGPVTIACPEGNVAGGATVKLTVVFSTSTGMTVTGSVSYGEGAGTPGQPTNSTQANTDVLSVPGDSADGGCFNGTPPPVHGSNALQATFAALDTTAADTSLPCTFVDAGVLDTSFAATGTIKSQISFVEFPTLASNGVGAVRVLFTPLPAGVSLNKLKLLEDTNYAVPYFKTFVTVPNCDRSGNIPSPVGIPAKGATDADAHGNDSCIYNRSPLPSGGGEIDLHVIGSPFDSHYGT